jgi:hypothetical protein
MFRVRVAFVTQFGEPTIILVLDLRSMSLPLLRVWAMCSVYELLVTVFTVHSSMYFRVRAAGRRSECGSRVRDVR